MKLGGYFIFLLEGMAFAALIVQGSTVVYPDITYQGLEIAYQTYSTAINTLLSPFAYLSTLGAFVDLLLIVLVVVAVLTLSSLRYRSLHKLSLEGALISLLVEVVILAYYQELVQGAMAKLPQMLGATTLTSALQFQQQEFESLWWYSIWNSSAYLDTRALLIVVVLACLVIGLLTSSPQVGWNSNATELPLPSALHSQESELAISRSSGKATKFCRYCGAKILRASKFCEECGENLTS